VAVSLGTKNLDKAILGDIRSNNNMAITQCTALVKRTSPKDHPVVQEN
jgi:hypothetical protein